MSGEYPRTNCMYWLTKNSDPNMANITTVIEPVPTLKRRSAKKLRFSIGWAV